MFLLHLPELGDKSRFIRVLLLDLGTDPPPLHPCYSSAELLLAR